MPDTKYTVMHRRDYHEVYGREPTVGGRDWGTDWFVLSPLGVPVDSLLTKEFADEEARKRTYAAANYLAGKGF